jgi:mannobiose 2-epimerase
MNSSQTTQLAEYKAAMVAELKHILDYWRRHTVDEENGGFYGKISKTNAVEKTAAKGAVLNARILWSFAAAYNLKAENSLNLADRAYQYILDHFLDHTYGGVYWTVDHKGSPLDTKKQVYAVAFTIYALSEYYLASGREESLQHAIALYHDLVKYSFDQQHGGYLEAFDREWKDLDDLRLSDKDANEKKTMNTHLHVLEAFTNLYRAWPDADLRVKIQGLLDDFQQHIIDKERSSMILFFDEYWNGRSNVISYGHDIEASWLLLEAAEVLADEPQIAALRKAAVKMADACLEGIDADGSLWYEQDPAKGHTIKEKHWWVQAEAMVGFFNAWQISGDPRYLEVSYKNWQFVQDFMLDKENGEWFWGVNNNGHLMAHEDKVGLWKCPYHNSRACMELMKRIKQ